jgi:cytochrome c oxidase accessory protein FixG
LLRDLFTGKAAYVAYATVATLTATTYVFAGWMREQVCNYMCPWPRIQAAMLDERSLIVTYKDWRGEPRSHGLKRQLDVIDVGTAGDCIDCMACVQVCPAGIDIRNGTQLECITCALCIDACDQMMARIGRPRGLIDYATLEDCKAEAAGAPPVPITRTLLRSRTLMYFGLWSAIGLAMVLSLGARVRLDLSVAHDRNPLWVQMADGDIRNAYTLKIRNMETRPRPVRITVEGLPGASLWDSLASEKQASTSLQLTVPADQVEKRRIYVRAPRSGPENYALRLEALDGQEAVDTDEVRFARPE